MSHEKVISASEVRAKIIAGDPVEFDNYTIIGGDLNLNELNIERAVHFNHTVFQNQVNSVSTIFNNAAYFSDSVFNGSATFWHSNFNGPVHFEFSTFKGFTDFQDSTFNGLAQFEHSRFAGTTYFKDSRFKGDAYFVNSNFSYACFTNSVFEKNAYFRDSTFDSSTTEFQNSTFNGLADFNYSGFNNVKFYRADFNKPAYFRWGKFNGTTDFGYSNFNILVNFDHSIFGKKSTFHEASFGKSASFRNSFFLGPLNLTNITIERFYIDWSAIMNKEHLDCNSSQTFLTLIKNAKDWGQDDASDDIFYSYKVWSQPEWNEGKINKFLDTFVYLTCGYGVRIMRTIGSFIFSLFVFAIFYYLYYFFIKKMSFSEINKLEVLCFSLTVLFSIPSELSLIGEDSYKNHAKIIRLLPILERILGWILMLIFIATLNRVFVRY